MEFFSVKDFRTITLNLYITLKHFRDPVDFVTGQGLLTSKK